MPRIEPLRNAAIASALEQALVRAKHDELGALLVRAGGLPGPRPNWRLAWAFAHSVAAAHGRADALVADLVAMDSRRAPPRSALEFLPVVGVFCVAARALVAPSLGPELDRLASMAEDPRHLVREAVVLALVELASERSEELVPLLGAWMAAYLPAAVALTALSARPWLDRIASAGSLIARLDEAFSLAENAGRADRRSQGYRALVDALSPAVTKIMERFSGPTLAWLETHVATEDVPLRQALHEIIDHAPSRSQLESVRAGLDANDPPRRDPRTYVGPTRRRGSRKG